MLYYVISNIKLIPIIVERNTQSCFNIVERNTQSCFNIVERNTQSCFNPYCDGAKKQQLVHDYSSIFISVKITIKNYPEQYYNYSS